MKYRHNDYYGYINKIQQKAILNPTWFWSDAASKERQWLYDNGASKIVDEIYENTPEDIKQNIDNKKLSSDIRTRRIKDNIYDTQKKFLDTAGAVGVTTLPLVAAAPAIVAAPGAMIGGAVAGALGAEGTNALVRKFSNGRYSNWGDFVTSGKSYGETLGTLADFTNPGAIVAGTIGGTAGNSAYKAAFNRFIFNQAIKDGTISFSGPTKQIVYHQSDRVIPKFEFSYNRWDVKTHNADPNGAFFSEQPATKGFLSERPVINKYEISADKSLVQHGDITPGIDQSKNGLRNYIVKQARKNGADIVKFEDIADNNLYGQNVYFVNDNGKIRLTDVSLSPKYNGPSLEEYYGLGYRIPGGDFSARPMGSPPSGNPYMYRIVGKPGIIDLLNTNTIRAKTGIHAASQSWIRENFPEFVSKYPNFAEFDRTKVSDILKSEFGWNPTLAESINLRNSTNHGGTVGYFEDITYPAYWNEAYKSHLPIIATPKYGVNKFKYGHHGKLFSDDNWGPAVLVDALGNNKNVIGDASDSKIFIWNNGKYMEVPR